MKSTMRRPSLVKVTEWVKKAWDLIPKEMVIKSFKKCGISNELDGTEDDILYEEVLGERPVKEGEGREKDVEKQASEHDTDDETDDEYIDYYDTPEITDEQVRELFISDNDSEEEFKGF